MANQTIANMIREELQRLIEQTVERKIIQLLGEESDLPFVKDEVSESIDCNMWSPPPGAKSSIELLREDRES